MVPLRVRAPAVEAPAREHEVVALDGRRAPEPADAVRDPCEPVGSPSPAARPHRGTNCLAFAWAAVRASTGTSSITSGSSVPSTRTDSIEDGGDTWIVPTGSPSCSSVTVVSVSIPMRAITSRKRRRVGFSPTSMIVSDERLRAAAAIRNAAEDGSPGTLPSNASCWNRVTDSPSSVRIGAPSAERARSV